jgi:hypothetical protein
LGGTKSATIDWSQIPVGIPVENLFWDGLVLTVGIVYALGIVAFLIRFGLDYYSLTKVFRENRSSAGRFQVYWRWGKTGAFFRFQHHCVQFGLIQRVRVAKHYWAWKVHSEQNHHRCFTHDYSASCSGSTRNLALPESDSQNLEFIADSEALLKISDKKAYQITLLK